MYCQNLYHFSANFAANKFFLTQSVTRNLASRFSLDVWNRILDETTSDLTQGVVAYILHVEIFATRIKNLLIMQ